MTQNPLSIRGLVKIHPGPVCALRGVDLEIPEGMFGLLGPNGAGKSTFMNIVAGLVEPTAGGVFLDGVDTVKNPRFMRERLGYLPQDFGFYPDLSGRAMLEFLLKLKGVTGPKGRRALADELLERVNLTSAAKRKVGGYSGGMRQRLGLAQAIAGNPRVLIVDEPTAGLDPEERQRFYRLLAEMSAGRVVLLSTHIVDDVSTLCPRLAVIRSGEVVADTTPAAACRAVDGLVYEGFVADAELPAFAQSHRVISAVLNEGRNNRVRVFVAPGRVPPSGFARTAGTLEDAYLVLMRCPSDEIPPALTQSAAPALAGGAA
ncbi:MAG: ATP-binding cassette domain-containing protein [Phycisphaera sp.]|nr:ATP-binding cassette domain-containing protein [Phycisphaera sp.]